MEAHTLKCIIHVGVHKTGSASIQGVLNGYKTKEYAYADMGEVNHSIPFQTLFLPHSMEGHWRRLGQCPIEKRKHYQERLAAALRCEQDGIIFSGENISSLDAEELRRMRVALERVCSEFKVVVFVRDPLSWAMSNMQETVKHGGLVRTDPAICERYRNLGRVFQNEEISIIKYEDRDLFDGDVVRLFFSALDLKLPIGYAPRHYNVSLRSGAYKVLSIHNDAHGSMRFGAEFEQAHWDFVNLVQALFQDSFKLTKSDFLPHCFPGDYNFLEKELGVVYEKPASSIPKAKDLQKLDDDTLGVICSYLHAQGSSFNWISQHKSAIRALYCYSVAKSLQKHRVARRDKARKYLWKYLKYATNLRFKQKE
ncbi:hypothetical protein [Ruegeria sp. HKCCA6837]|uniref:hypothetical protein n=1 Tax=Ruegeria sp. HKCCA6837 TaxID=2682989 RepID=UPI0014878E8A|nr:hypothetical protein [Ruegeria sp. HKCCA6837]